MLISYIICEVMNVFAKWIHNSINLEHTKRNSNVKIFINKQ